MPDLSSQQARLTCALESLVGFNTENPPGHEWEAIGWLGNRLRAMGFTVETQEFAQGRANVAARLENGDGPTFAFNSHVDVVPAGDGWSTDPFRLRADDGRLYGRGACDAKGSIVAMLAALEALSSSRGGWAGTLMAVFVGDEEVASAGAKAYVRNAPPIDYVVIGEPTNNAPVIAHKGSLRPLVRVHGRTAHSGTPDLGVNAILKSSALLNLVEREHQVVSRRRHDLVGAASLTVTRIAGGHADNVVPDRCDLLLDRRMVPGEDEAEVRGELQRLLDTALAEFGVEAEIVEFKATTGGATETSAGHPIVKAARAACDNHGREDAPLGGFQGGCDLVHFRSAGAQGLVLGPGSLAVAHKPDEYVLIDELVQASRIYRDIAVQMLGGAI